MHVSDDVRAGLERRPRKWSDIDKDAALAALRLEYGSAYLVDIDKAGIWWALRPDGLPAVSGTTPDELRSAILADIKADKEEPR